MVVVSGFEYNINELYREAQTRWLKPVEVMYILQNHEKYQFTQEPPQQPTSNLCVLFIKLMTEIKMAAFSVPVCFLRMNTYFLLLTLPIDFLNRWIPVSL